MSARGRPGTIYTLHFDRPYKHAAHCTGRKTCVLGSPSTRPGGAPRLLAVVKAAGIGWQLATTQEGTRSEERRLKQHGAARRCPVCQEEKEGNTVPFPDEPEGYEEEPEAEDYDPGPECDDEGGMSEHRYMIEPEDPWASPGYRPEPAPPMGDGFYRAIGDYARAENAKAEPVNGHPGPDSGWQPEAGQ